MHLSNALSHLLNETSIKKSLSENLVNTITEWNSVTPECLAPLIANLFLTKQNKLTVITNSYDSSIKLESRLHLCGVPKEKIFILPSGISALFDDALPEINLISERIGTLYESTLDESCIIITTPQAAIERTLPKEIFLKKIFRYSEKDDISPEKMIENLTQLGYQSDDPVQSPGTFCKRGGLIDIYPMGSSNPIRIEFFGDTIERIKYFSPTLQTSIGTTEYFTILPAAETLYPEDLSSFQDILERTLDIECSKLEETSAENLRKNISNDIENLNLNNYFQRLSIYHPFIYPNSGSFLSYLDENTTLILDNIDSIKRLAEKCLEDLQQSLLGRVARGEILSSHATDFLEENHIFLNHPSTLCITNLEQSNSNSVKFNTASLTGYIGNFPELLTNIKRWINEDVKILFATDQPQRVINILLENKIPHTNKIEETSSKTTYLANGNIAGGFILPDAKLAVITDLEIFGVQRLKLTQKKFQNSLPVSTLLDLKEGDYVVHINFGIGIFKGLTTRNVAGIEKECLHIEYAAPDKLFVPVDQLDRVQKYLNPGDSDPKVYRITGGDWKTTVSKARENARLFARELIKLYAERKKTTREQYGDDTPWQEEMESTFPWTETPSQLEAIKDVKKDMNSPYPMDRLICGDVGFGKTEVAIRGAFKAVMSKKQVAVLCPTTVLSEQHYRNFSERLASFGVNLAVLNRFTSTTEKKKITADLKSGDINLIIGTHALLNKKLEFHNLGMIIIDEEQKFGVKQKELLKEVRTSVDVLSMSATPIPRTLSMAMMDVRQMSLINDPPPGRLPVRTFVKPFSKAVILEAILRELTRGGQVYYVYNRIEGIYHIQERLRKMFPNARIGVGHGQMTEKELEPVMVEFVKGELDILLCTTIIENGIDISSANTIIVEGAEKLGLSQLYQLKGRVGRSNRQAYAYFLYADSKSLTENSLARLESLQQYSSLGSGYSLAYRDLQIRGAGNMLGAKQHGTMASVGYELYTELISQEVKYLKNIADTGNTKSSSEPDALEGLKPLPSVDLPIKALIPVDYIQEEAQRLYYYKQIMCSRDYNTLNTIREEVEDRYGSLPDETINVFHILRLRIECIKLGICKISTSPNELVIQFEESEIPTRWVLGKLQSNNPRSKFRDNRLFWPTSENILDVCKTLLENINHFTVREQEIREINGV